MVPKPKSVLRFLCTHIFSLSEFILLWVNSTKTMQSNSVSVSIVVSSVCIHDSKLFHVTSNLVLYISDLLNVSDQVIAYNNNLKPNCVWYPILDVLSEREKRKTTKHSYRCRSYKYLLLWIWINFDAVKYQIHTYFTTWISNYNRSSNVKPG